MMCSWSSKVPSVWGRYYDLLLGFAAKHAFQIRPNLSFQYISIHSSHFLLCEVSQQIQCEHLHSLKAAIRPPRMTPERSEVRDVVPESGGRVLMAIH